MINKDFITQSLAIFSVVLLPLSNIVAFNIIELKRSSFSLIFEPFIILVILGLITNLFLLSINFYSIKLGKFLFLLIIPFLFLFFYFRFFVESLLSLILIEYVILIIIAIIIFLIIATIFL